MRKLVIDRAKWQCAGHRDGATFLLNDVGKMCCLGFQAIAVGYSVRSIKGKSDPCEVARGKSCKPGLPVSQSDGYWANLAWADLAIEINDKVRDDANRESQLTELFAANGWELVFTGEYPEQAATSASAPGLSDTEQEAS